MLEDRPRTDLPKRASKAETRLREWRRAAREAREPLAAGQASVAPDGAGQPLVLTDFQDEWAAFATAMRLVAGGGP